MGIDDLLHSSSWDISRSCFISVAGRGMLNSFIYYFFFSDPFLHSLSLDYSGYSQQTASPGKIQTMQIPLETTTNTKQVHFYGILRMKRELGLRIYEEHNTCSYRVCRRPWL